MDKKEVVRIRASRTHSLAGQCIRSECRLGPTVEGNDLLIQTRVEPNRIIVWIIERFELIFKERVSLCIHNKGNKAREIVTDSCRKPFQTKWNQALSRANFNLTDGTTTYYHCVSLNPNSRKYEDMQNEDSNSPHSQGCYEDCMFLSGPWNIPTVKKSIKYTFPASFFFFFFIFKLYIIVLV